MKTNNLLLLGTLAVVLPACKMPPKQAWRQIQSEGLIAYMGAEPMQRQVANEGREAGSSLGTFAWNEGSPSDSRPTDRSAFGLRSSLGIPVSGHPGFVYSPHAPEKMVNVINFRAGQQVRCPHTKKMFIVPNFSKPAPSIASTPLPRDPRSPRERMQFEPNLRGTTDFLDVAETGLDPEPMPEPAPTEGSLVVPDGMTAKPVPGRSNQVYSPYARENQIVDITGMRPGQKARCPYTNRVFVIPGLAEASVGEQNVASVADTPDVRALNSRTAPKREMPVKPKPTRVAAPKPKPEPAPVPEIELDPEPAEPVPAPKAAPEPVKEKPAPEKPVADGSTPTASWSDKSGYVKSPYGGHLVDVRGKSAGSAMRCPFSGKTFKVPSGSN